MNSTKKSFCFCQTILTSEHHVSSSEKAEVFIGIGNGSPIFAVSLTLATIGYVVFLK